MNLKQGDIVELRVSILGNAPGSKGVVVWKYTDIDPDGAYILLANGNYDGFSHEEQTKFLIKVGHSRKIESYKFKHVIQLSNDYYKGEFDSVFI